MRTDWVSPSAATLVVGAFALVLGTMLSPTDGGENANQALRVVNQNEGRMLGMAVFYFLASLGLMLGIGMSWSHIRRRRQDPITVSPKAESAPYSTQDRAQSPPHRRSRRPR